jgi:hypothetical protein
MRKGRGEVKRVVDLFEKYRRTLVAPERSVRAAFIEVVEDLAGITIPDELVTYKPSSRTLFVAANGMVKSEIMLRREEILAHLKGRLGERGAPTTIL